MDEKTIEALASGAPDPHQSALDELRDRERCGGPVTDGMVLTVLNAHCRSSHMIPHREFDCVAIAREINSWLTPVND